MENIDILCVKREGKSMSELGKGLKPLGFGFMRLPKVDNVIDMEATKEMVDYFMDRGFTYFDTAVPYLEQKSEAALKSALVDRYPRESYQIATKCSIQCCSDEVPPAVLFENSLKNIGVDYVDYYLIHAMNKAKAKQYEDVGAWELVKDLKKQGKIKHFGFSFHDQPEVLEEILTAHPETEFVQLQINYADMENPAVQSRRCYEIAKAHGKPIIIMEPVKGGTLAAVPTEAEEALRAVRPEETIASWALRYALSLDNVFMVLSGMSHIDHVMDNVVTAESDLVLTEADKLALKKVVDVLEAIPTIPCTDCKYCTENCPMEINIPRYFGVMNLHLRYDSGKTEPSNVPSFNFAAKNAAKPSACISCGTCEARCPQGIPIIQELDNITKAYEGS